MRPHDDACKLLFAFPEMVRDLLGGFGPRAWAADLTSTVSRRPVVGVAGSWRRRSAG